MSLGPRAGALTAEPNGTPMIDVLMVLLVIFMLIVPASRRAVDVRLPDPHAPPAGDAPASVLEVGPGGTLALNRQPVDEAALGARLRAVYAGRPNKVLTVRGDRRARYQAVVAAVDSARSRRAGDRPGPAAALATAALTGGSG